MNNQRISSRDAEELASGRVPSARRDLEPLAALMEDYRRAATTQSRIQPSAALAARLDLDNTPEFPLEQAPDTDRSNTAVRAGSGLLGVGLAVLITLGAASGAAALAGSAGVLPPGAQDAFDDLVSVIVPTEGAADETTDDGEAPSDTLPDTGTSPDATEGAAEPTPEPMDTPEVENETEDDNFGDRVAELKDETESGQEFGERVSEEAHENGNGAENGNGNGVGNGAGNGNGNGAGNGNGNGNSAEKSNNGNGNGNNAEKSNNGNGNGNKHDDDDEDDDD